jgi:hypothetical protein
MVHRDHENGAGTNKLDATRQARQFLHGSNAYLAVGSLAALMAIEIGLRLRR